MIDMRAFERHADAVTARMKRRFAEVEPMAKAMQANPAYTADDVRLLGRKKREIQEAAINEMMAFFKPLRRRCHHPMQVLALAEFERTVRARLTEEMNKHLGDMDEFDRQLDNAAAGEDDFAALVADALQQEGLTQ